VPLPRLPAKVVIIALVPVFGTDWQGTDHERLLTLVAVIVRTMSRSLVSFQLLVLLVTVIFLQRRTRAVHTQK
jgi:hypothetical protein